MRARDSVEAESLGDGGYLLQHPSAAAPSAHRRHGCPGPPTPCETTA